MQLQSRLERRREELRADEGRRIRRRTPNADAFTPNALAAALNEARQRAARAYRALPAWQRRGITREQFWEPWRRHFHKFYTLTDWIFAPANPLRLPEVARDLLNSIEGLIRANEGASATYAKQDWFAAQCQSKQSPILARPTPDDAHIDLYENGKVRRVWRRIGDRIRLLRRSAAGISISLCQRLLRRLEHIGIIGCTRRNHHNQYWIPAHPPATPEYEFAPELATLAALNGAAHRRATQLSQSEARARFAAARTVPRESAPDTMPTPDAAPTAPDAMPTPDAGPTALDAMPTPDAAPTAPDAMPTPDAGPTALDAMPTPDAGPTALDAMTPPTAPEAAPTLDAVPEAAPLTGDALRAYLDEIMPPHLRRRRPPP